MSWDFNHKAVLRSFGKIISAEVGDRLSTLKGSTDKAVIMTETNGILPETPYVSLRFIPSIDSDSWVIDTGTIEVEVPDPDNPPDTVLMDTLYYDTIVNFNVEIKVVSKTKYANEDALAFAIMRDIRKCLILDKHRRALKDEVFTVVALGDNRIISTPDLLAKDYYDIATMRLRCSSVDRTINYDSGVFDHASWIGTIKRDPDDPNPELIIGGTPAPIVIP